MTVDVDLGKGVATLRVDEKDPDAAFFNQNEQVNEFLQEAGAGKGPETFHSGKYKPFEAREKSGNKDPQSVFNSLKSFEFKACTLNDEKSQKLYDDLNPDNNWLKKGKKKTNEPTKKQ